MEWVIWIYWTLQNSESNHGFNTLRNIQFNARECTLRNLRANHKESSDTAKYEGHPTGQHTAKYEGHLKGKHTAKFLYGNKLLLELVTAFMELTDKLLLALLIAVSFPLSGRWCGGGGELSAVIGATDVIDWTSSRAALSSISYDSWNAFYFWCCRMTSNDRQISSWGMSRSWKTCFFNMRALPGLLVADLTFCSVHIALISSLVHETCLMVLLFLFGALFY